MRCFVGALIRGAIAMARRRPGVCGTRRTQLPTRRSTEGRADPVVAGRALGGARVVSLRQLPFLHPNHLIHGASASHHAVRLVAFIRP